MSIPANKISVTGVLAVLVGCCLLLACSSVKHVPDGSLLLNSVNIDIQDSTKTFDEEQMALYLRQIPNHKFLWCAKLQLGVYNLSGKDTTKWWNRWIQRIGEPPVIYDPELTDLSAKQLRQAMINKGFLSAKVVVDTIAKPEKKKIDVNYTLLPGLPHLLKNIEYQIDNDSVAAIVNRRLTRSLIRESDPLDMNLLDAERERITADLRNRGYFGYSKDYISFSADTTHGSTAVDLTVMVTTPKTRPGQLNVDSLLMYEPRTITNVYVVPNYDPATMLSMRDLNLVDTLHYERLNILTNSEPYLRPAVLAENIFIVPGHKYSEYNVTRTYQALARLEILRFVNIQMIPNGATGLDAYIMLTPGKPQTITLELEGTNSEGDLGMATAIGYSHRNIGRGSETFTAKVRGAYESLSGNLDGLIHDRYMEYSLNLGLNFPKFKFPFLSSRFKRRIQAATDLHMSVNYQERPEYTRVIASAGFSYTWKERWRSRRHVWTPLDINYVYLPESTQNFIDLIAPDNPLLRYSYEDHFIMSMAYRLYISNKRQESQYQRRAQNDVWTLRFNAETAGNLLFAINSILTHRDDVSRNPYKVFGINYSQYVKAEIDYGFAHAFDTRNSLAFHVAFGAAFPYGNSRILPFEKRFYGGGANGVRGWDVRTLGPGCYDASNSVSSFINQCGDILLTLSAEYRAKLFWFIEGALFVDAGNIWTIHAYDNQEGGMFHFNTFYKQLAASYGVGIRLNFNYFLIRVDMGMKAHNPAKKQEPWPLIHPKWGRDSSFHFSIGYPF
ncbi:MAG: outer membrane protein assembly factor [Prevotella sp.]|nr:outer membrane protein assembly factor [Prevotella sp.]MCM1074641.1 outer membrane protein assembly factor [Ruminococcus sp.]